jgi:hypothetical protein
MKTCRICKLEKIEQDFRLRRPGVYRTECIDCSREISNEIYRQNKTKPKIVPKTKKCARCHNVKSTDEFSKHPSHKDGLSSSCKSCVSVYYQSEIMQQCLIRQKESGKHYERLAKYRNGHKSEINQRKRDLRQATLESIRKTESDYGYKRRKKVHEIMGGKCIRCGETKTERLSIDHINNDGAEERASGNGIFTKIVGRILKGEEWKHKYQLLCFNCNRKKQILFLRNKDKNDSPELTETKVCSQCHKELPIGCFTKSKYKTNRVSYCKWCSANYSIKRKLKILELLGGKCSNCGISDPDVLELDHINNDGAENRKLGIDKSIYLKIASGKRTIEGLQLLCANCNFEKAFRAVHHKYRK